MVLRTNENAGGYCMASSTFSKLCEVLLVYATVISKFWPLKMFAGGVMASVIAGSPTRRSAPPLVSNCVFAAASVLYVSFATTCFTLDGSPVTIRLDVPSPLNLLMLPGPRSPNTCSITLCPDDCPTNETPSGRTMESVAFFKMSDESLVRAMLNGKGSPTMTWPGFVNSMLTFGPAAGRRKK